MFWKDIHQMLHIFRTNTHTHTHLFSLSQLVPLFLRHSISQLVEKVKVTFLLHKNSSGSKLDTFFIKPVITCNSYSRHKQSLAYTNCDRFHGNKCNQRLGASPGNWMMVWRIKKMHVTGQDGQRHRRVWHPAGRSPDCSRAHHLLFLTEDSDWTSFKAYFRSIYRAGVWKR